MPTLRRDVSILDHTDRINQSTAGRLGEQDLDPRLQQIVAEAAHLTSFPIALVSLVRRRTQFFRAHVGLPPDLLVTRATDRCASFCQFCVSSGEPVAIVDAVNHAELPLQLIASHGIRAYVGFPVRVGGYVVGTLCVIDTKPRELSETQHQQLQSLANEVEIRLDELASESLRRGEAQQIALRPAFGELNNLLMGIAGTTHTARACLIELEPIFEQLEALRARRLSGDDLVRSLPLLEEAAQARTDLGGALEDMEDIRRSLTATLTALREMLTQEKESRGADGPAESLTLCVATSSNVANHATKIVGGVSWDNIDPALHVLASGCRPTLVLTTALTLFAGALFGSTGGIRGSIHSDIDVVTATLSAAQLSKDSAHRVASGLATMVGNSVKIDSDAGRLRITFARA